MTRRTLTALALAGAAALAAAPASARPHAAKKPPVKKPPVKKVGVFDNYYLPLKLSVARGTTIAWTWTEEVADLHDVKLAKGPKGVKKFGSLEGTAGYVYKKTLTTPGVYKFVCSFHEADGMVMAITVRK